MKRINTFILTSLGIGTSMPVLAQSDSNLYNDLMKMDSSQLTLLIMVAVVLGLIILLLVWIVCLMESLSSALKMKSLKEDAASISWWAGFKLKHITGKVKTEKDMTNDEMMGHSYDGIRELDNFMPPWLQYVFYLSIGFGIIYFINYSVLGLGMTQSEEYEQELRIAAMEAEKRKLLALSSIDETNVVFDATESSLKEGRSIYENNCVACHASDGGGGVGPNLTDEYWVHGGSIRDVFTVVKYGVPSKGMIPWEDQLSPEQMQQVSSYILTLVGTTPLNPKEPQGEKYEPAIEQPLDVITEDELGLEPVSEEG